MGAGHDAGAWATTTLTRSRVLFARSSFSALLHLESSSGALADFHSHTRYHITPMLPKMWNTLGQCSHCRALWVQPLEESRSPELSCHCHSTGSCMDMYFKKLNG